MWQSHGYPVGKDVLRPSSTPFTVDCPSVPETDPCPLNWRPCQLFRSRRPHPFPGLHGAEPNPLGTIKWVAVHPPVGAAAAREEELIGGKYFNGISVLCSPTICAGFPFGGKGGRVEVGVAEDHVPVFVGPEESARPPDLCTGVGVVNNHGAIYRMGPHFSDVG